MTSSSASAVAATSTAVVTNADTVPGSPKKRKASGEGDREAVWTDETLVPVVVKRFRDNHEYVYASLWGNVCKIIKDVKRWDPTLVGMTQQLHPELVRHTQARFKRYLHFAKPPSDGTSEWEVVTVDYVEFIRDVIDGVDDASRARDIIRSALDFRDEQELEDRGALVPGP